MGYPIQITGMEGRNIEVEVSFWGGPKLLIDNEPAPKGQKSGEMLLQRNDGSQVTATWKAQALGFDIPQLVVDGQVVKILEPLTWYQLAWGGLPLIMIFGGGLLGGVAGAIGFSLNTKLFRSEMNEILKYAATGLVSILTVIAYFILALLFSMLINR